MGVKQNINFILLNKYNKLITINDKIKKYIEENVDRKLKNTLLYTIDSIIHNNLCIIDFKELYKLVFELYSITTGIVVQYYTPELEK